MIGATMTYFHMIAIGRDSMRQGGAMEIGFVCRYVDFNIDCIDLGIDTYKAIQSTYPYIWEVKNSDQSFQPRKFNRAIII